MTVRIDTRGELKVGISYKALRKDEKEAIKEQRGQCELCGKTDGLVIDHNHDTDVVRGVLCNGCNIRIGWIETLDYRWLQLAGDYLGGHQTARAITQFMQLRFQKMEEQWYAELSELDRRRQDLQNELTKAQRRATEIAKHLRVDAEPGMRLPLKTTRHRGSGAPDEESE